MSEKPTKPNTGKLKLRKTSVKDLNLRTDKARKVKGGLGHHCVEPSTPNCTNHTG